MLFRIMGDVLTILKKPLDKPSAMCYYLINKSAAGGVPIKGTTI